MPELPSESELFDGRMEDGGKPPLHSAELYAGWPEPIPGGDENKPPHELDREQLHFLVDQTLLQDLDECREFCKYMIAIGRGAQADPEQCTSSPTRKGGETPPQATGPEQADAEDEPERSAPGGANRGGRGYCSMDSEYRLPGGEQSRDRKACPEPAERGAADDLQPKKLLADTKQWLTNMLDGNQCRQGPSTSLRVAAPNTGQIKFEQAVMIGERGVKLLHIVAAKRAEVAHRLIDAATQLDIRKRFLQDRAHAVVYQLLLHLDEEFREVGFGSWMPFRFPDQWLSFCGIMQRVLAANGLVHSEHAEVYRRLLDETPPVDAEGTLQDRVQQARTPMNLGLCHENRGAETMTALHDRLQAEIWNPPNPPPRKQYARW